MDHSKLCAAIFAGTLLSVGLSVGDAGAATITFETATPETVFSGATSVTESGYTYSPLSGYLYVNVYGNPGQDMEGYGAGGGGVLDIVKFGGGDFSLSQFDYSAYDNLVAGSQTLTVTGLLGSSTVATDTFTLPNRDDYSNWTTEVPTNLLGQNIDELQFDLNGFSNSDQYSYETIDNVVLATTTNVPEPFTLSLFGAGLAGAAALRRRKKATA